MRASRLMVVRQLNRATLPKYPKQNGIQKKGFRTALQNLQMRRAGFVGKIFSLSGWVVF